MKRLRGDAGGEMVRDGERVRGGRTVRRGSKREAYHGEETGGMQRKQPPPRRASILSRGDY